MKVLDARELEQIIDEYGIQVYRFCLSLSKRKPDAEDLYQQTFLKLFELGKEIHWDNNPRSFLFSIAGGIWKNEQRKQLRRATDPIEDLTSIASPGSTESEVLTHLETEEVKKAVGRLPAKFRIPLILQYTFEMSLEEISKTEGIPIGTVKSRLYHAKELITKEMEANGYGQPVQR